VVDEEEREGTEGDGKELRPRPDDALRHAEIPRGKSGR
jgi:hypothetical protein